MKHVIEKVVFGCDWALADCRHFLVSPELVFFNLRNEKVEQVGMVSDSPSSRPNSYCFVYLDFQKSSKLNALASQGEGFDGRTKAWILFL